MIIHNRYKKTKHKNRNNKKDTNKELIKTCEDIAKTTGAKLSFSANVDEAVKGANVIYIELRLQPYDYAAASVILEEAGGVITKIGGGEISLTEPCSILAGTKKAHKEVMAIAKEKGYRSVTEFINACIDEKLNRMKVQL